VKRLNGLKKKNRSGGTERGSVRKRVKTQGFGLGGKTERRTNRQKKILDKPDKPGRGETLSGDWHVPQSENNLRQSVGGGQLRTCWGAGTGNTIWKKKFDGFAFRSPPGVQLAGETGAQAEPPQGRGAAQKKNI